ncbi:nSTAND1 domain-containing NTPase [Catellatospora coxensis]|uniref:HTH cro/C1-type domain-containing protein n=1 Tax=Catellatospora coxensis TaxID=310354 RepID=A0A8J3P960_9ACTN|nr:SUMF1/EgtB/PvdO family nonheme iron enzyme [Catellatospora coxensis]GIG08043.1 hypothetical protein Cco03nite_47430 [Catellatospora coxensis]
MSPDMPDLGELLRRLRLEARLSQRDLALRVGFHESGVSNIERGERAPSAQYLTSVIAALRLDSANAELIWRLYRAPGMGAGGTGTGDGTPCPYRGLFAFREEDAALFFGRGTAVRRILRRLEAGPLVAVVGASGSGKSSVVLAGVLPRLRAAGHWDVAVTRPGTDPQLALVEAISPGASSVMEAVGRRLFGSGQRLLVVVDQFEEVFTHSADDSAPVRFLDDLVAIVQAGDVKLVLTFRGDFYGRLVAHRAFSDVLQDHVVHLPPMNRIELLQAVTEPARAAGLTLEQGLTEQILDDAGLEPGNLPLVEFALTRLWERRAGSTLTIAAYEQIGRLAGSITARAEEVYTSLSPEQQYAARQLFVRLVQVSRPEEDGNDARRRTPLAEVTALPGVDTVVRALADARLVVTDADAGSGPTVELAHEAIIRSWQRLRGWLVEDRQFLLWQQRTRQWASEWRRAPDQDAAVLRGGILDEAHRWLTLKGRESIAPDLLGYLDTSIAQARAEEQRQALARVEQLVTVLPRDVPQLAATFADADPQLRAQLRGRLDTAAIRQRWRLRLALLTADREQAKLLLGDLNQLWPDELIAVRDAVGPHRDLMTEHLWQAAHPASAPLLANSVLLAAGDPDDTRWHDIAATVAAELVRQNQLHLRTYVDALRPVRLHLLEPLFTLFADESELRAANRETRAVVLLDLAADQPELLARMAADAMPQNYEAIFEALATAVTDDAVRVLKVIAHTEPDNEAAEVDRVRLGRRRAAALSTLLRLGVRPDFDEVLTTSGDTELLTQFTFSAATRLVPPELLLDHASGAVDQASRYGLLLALGEYASHPDADRLTSRIDALSQQHLATDDPGVRAAATWLRRRWALPTQELPAAYDPTGRRRWFTVTTPRGPLRFVVFRPGRFLMGSPGIEAERSDYESPRQDTTITRSFAMCDREVTRAEFEDFMAATGIRGLPNIDEWSPLGHEPVVAPTWHEALLYADWLGSRLTGREQTYDAVGDALNQPRVQQGLQETDMRAMLNAPLRLPTEAEWEYACRAGTTTAYSFGSDRTLLDRHGWFADNSGLKTHEAGILRPNPAGLFNIHGQCWEWCLDWYGPYTDQPVVDPVGPATGDRKVLRGGCWNLGARYARSACRNAHIPPNRNYYITFRLALTVPEVDPTWQPGDLQPLPWTGR